MKSFHEIASVMDRRKTEPLYYLRRRQSSDFNDNMLRHSPLDAVFLNELALKILQCVMGTVLWKI
jgi:hypothetical protein